MFVTVIIVQPMFFKDITYQALLPDTRKVIQMIGNIGTTPLKPHQGLAAAEYRSFAAVKQCVAAI